MIDVEGADRVIQKIEFWYDAQSGRQAGQPELTG
jgi:hypothetical protein